MRTRIIAAVAFAVIVLAPRPAAAWGIEVHKFIMGRAIALLPSEIRPYFEKYHAGIVEPLRRRSGRVWGCWRGNNGAIPRLLSVSD